MHLRNESAFSLASHVIPYIEKCDTYIGETNLDDLNAVDMNQYFMFSEEDDLQKAIGIKKFNKYQSILLKAFNIDIARFTKFKPIFIVNLITDSILKPENPYSLDDYLWREATSLGKKMVGLESLTSQKDTFSKITLEYQLKQLKDICKNIPKFRKKLLALSNDYSKQDINQLYKKSKNSMGNMKGVLIYNRNQLMTNEIMNFASKNSCFFAFGAGHLSGEFGVLKLLKDNKCIIKPIALKV